MSYCIAQGTLLNVRWQPGWKGCLWDKDTCTCVTESLYCPPETQNIVYQLYSKTKLKIKKKKKKELVGDPGEEQAFSAEKTRSRSQKERNRECQGNQGTLLFFSRKPYCSMADQCYLKFCCTPKCFSCTYTNIHILFH